MKRLFKIIFIVCLFSTSTVKAQVGLNPNQTPGFSTHSFNNYQTTFNINQPAFSNTIFNKTHFNGFVFNENSAILSPKIYAYHDLAFFCKVEVKLEKAASFPVKLRLGDVNYVDQLEGK